MPELEDDGFGVDAATQFPHEYPAATTRFVAVDEAAVQKICEFGAMGLAEVHRDARALVGSEDRAKLFSSDIRGCAEKHQDAPSISGHPISSR
jgi:hypothetical protein